MMVKSSNHMLVLKYMDYKYISVFLEMANKSMSLSMFTLPQCSNGSQVAMVANRATRCVSKMALRRRENYQSDDIVFSWLKPPPLKKKTIVICCLCVFVGQDHLELGIRLQCWVTPSMWTPNQPAGLLLHESWWEICLGPWDSLRSQLVQDGQIFSPKIKTPTYVGPWTMMYVYIRRC